MDRKENSVQTAARWAGNIAAAGIAIYMAFLILKWIVNNPGKAVLLFLAAVSAGILSDCGVSDETLQSIYVPLGFLIVSGMMVSSYWDKKAADEDRWAEPDAGFKTDNGRSVSIPVYGAVAEAEIPVPYEWGGPDPRIQSSMPKPKPPTIAEMEQAEYNRLAEEDRRLKAQSIRPLDENWLP